MISTTSCFAPRIPDDVVGIAELCKKFKVPHLINNAYGLQCSKICHKLNLAMKAGRVDAIVQSSDKNFLVPVGGSIVASSSRDLVKRISKIYAGRASVAPILDLFITLLGMGSNEFLKIRKQRIELVDYFVEKFSEVAKKHGERLLVTKTNTISFAITLNNLLSKRHLKLSSEGRVKALTKFGSMLFHSRSFWS